MNSIRPIRLHRALASALLLGALFPCPGCLQSTNLAPKPVRIEETGTEFEAEFKILKDSYDAAITNPANAAAARVARDRMIFRLRVEIDKWYAQLEQDLHQNRAAFNTWTDFLELGLAGAGALASQVDAKTRFATVLAVGKGTRLSYDKNWYGEKATESLINAMRTGRNLQLAEIIKKMTANDADHYTYEEAWGDLIAYYEAGTVQGALVLLSATTGAAATKSDQDVKDASKPRYPALAAATAALVTETGAVAAKAMALKPDQKREVFKTLKVTVPDGATDDKLTELMNGVVQRLATATAEDRKLIVDTINKY